MREGVEIVAAQGLVQRVAGVPGLYPHLAARRLFGVAAGTPRRLHQQREQALGRPKVAAEQRGVGVHRGHQRDAPEVVPLGDHLRADQHIHVTGVHGTELRFERPLEACAVGINAGDARGSAVGAQQHFAELLFEFFGAAAQRCDIQVAALGAGARHRLGQAAVVAAQAAVEFVEHAPGAAMRAAALPATVGAVKYGCVTTAVQEHQALLALRDALLQGGDQRRRQGCGHALRFGQQVHVDQPHPRQRPTADASRQAEPDVAPLVGTLPTFQRRCGRAQQHRHRFEPPTVHRHVACRVARALLLFVRRVMFFIDDDQAEARHRREHGQPRTQHQVGQAQVRGEPVAQALGRRQRTVQRDDVAAREALREARLQLWREVDFGHQHQGLAPFVQRLRGSTQIDLGLAAAGHAVQQHGRRLARLGESAQLFQHPALFVAQARLGGIGLMRHRDAHQSTCSLQ